MRKTRNLRESFSYALQGVLHCITHERNIRIHLSAAGLALLLAWFLRLSGTEFAILFLTIGFVISVEMVNTAVENAVDLFSPNFHPLARVVKDVTAGAVLFACTIAVAVGLILFVPKLWDIFF